MTIIFVGTDGRAPLLLDKNTDKLRMSYLEIEGVEDS